MISFYRSYASLSLFIIITIRKRSLGKVMFSQACVSHFVHRGEGLHHLDRDHAGQKSPLDRALSEQRRLSTEISNPAKMATAAEGIHPTGMHSCYYYD